MNLRTFGFGTSVSAAALLLGMASSEAGQSTITFDICNSRICDELSSDSYIGTGYDAALDDRNEAGAAEEAGSDSVSDAYDTWGILYGSQSAAGGSLSNVTSYATGFNGLAAWRQTESYAAIPELPGNSVRWFDSFTNNTGAVIEANIVFGGNLGSDGGTYIHSVGQGFFVTGDRLPGNRSNDPVIAHLYGNNQYAFALTTSFANGDDEPFIVFPIAVAPGQTVSIMNVNLLFGDTDRDDDTDGSLYAADVALAIQQAELFVNSPIFAGLTAAQVQSLINWNVAIDGSLPAAGGLVALSQRVHEAYDILLNRDAAWIGGVSAQIASGALHYASDDAANGSDGAAALARSVSDAGGKVRISGFEGDQAFLFGGYTVGSQTFSAGDLDFGGYVTGLGIEHAVTPELLLGLAGGYGHGNGDIDGVYSDLDNTQFTLSPYARWQAPNGTMFDARLSASSERWSYARAAGAGTANADVDGYSLGARLGAAHDFDMAWAKVTPFANLSYLRTHVNDYTETGAGAANLAVPSYDVDRLETFAGVGLSRSWQLAGGTTLRGFGSLGLGAAFLGDDGAISTRYTTSATSFLSQLETGEGAFGRFEAGLAVDLGERIGLTSSYAASFGADREQHTLKIGLSGKL
ncbi:autotransporter outer membrane beta-barrel domain-containing protein [Aminobacter sp. MET-1]|uniref:autotransporter outer membrane beta-barrel domain-containing protein n=1 Tax=Aminobacter sp. MET-1 TaxID=2951085 RepID=UPI00226AE3F5|nr:autotransporter outer membrane beta-barrel domain-containing protein [Aminobacter sp. MET-1]MCX8568466.1 autotransporter outer membrane beta-barrel domain-containing protein [Aminobacter sp. MET-1]